MNHRHGVIPILIAGMFLAAGPGVQAAQPGGTTTKIKKCQDAEGRWHYGDTADEACAQSRVIEITGKGVKTKEIAAPLTAEELKEHELRKAQEQEERKQAEEEARRDKLLLSTYTHEDDIIMTRDRKIADLAGAIKATEETLGALRAALSRSQAQAAQEQRGGQPVSPQTAKTIANTEKQIAKHEVYIETKKREQEETHVRYQADLERFREIKNRSTIPGAP